MSKPASKIEIEWRGRERFQATWNRQIELHKLRRAGKIGDRLVFVEHEPVITMGKRGDNANLVVSQAELQQRGVGFHLIERGGDITFHGPGQLVCYLIVDLRKRGLSVRGFVRLIEQAIIRTLAHYGIEATTIAGLTGVWVNDTKLAAIGLAIKGGVSYHGLALNITTDLSFYGLIVPCGIREKQVGSIISITGNETDIANVRSVLEQELTDALIGLD